MAIIGTLDPCRGMARQKIGLGGESDASSVRRKIKRRRDERCARSTAKELQSVKRILSPAILLLTFSLFLVLPSRAQSSAPLEVVITGGHIIDGTGSPWYSGDIGIHDGRVAAIGNLSGAVRKQ